jgi:5-(carboxyamino)imidazole ribonucleotide mutase
MMPGSKSKSQKVAILMGSPNDMNKMQGAVDALDLFGIESDVQVLSAHRQPSKVSEMATNGRERGYMAFICGAWMSAHLAGVVSAHTTLPVVGVPISSGNLNGLDALYSTVQMPKGIPVATVAIDGSYNAGMLVAQILGINDKVIANKIRHLRHASNDKC